MCGGFFFGLGLPGGARKAQPGGGGYNRKKVSMLRSNTAIL